MKAAHVTFTFYCTTSSRVRAGVCVPYIYNMIIKDAHSSIILFRGAQVLYIRAQRNPLKYKSRAI